MKHIESMTFGKLHNEVNVLICGLQLPREPYRSTRLLKMTGRWQYDGIM